MSDLTTKEQELALEFGTRVGEELANEHSEILQTYFPHFVTIKSHCEKAKEIEEKFHSAKTDDERLELAPLAKAMSIAFSKVTGKDGIKPLKPQLKAYTTSYNKAVDGCHNHIEALKKEGQYAMQNIASYADVIAQRAIDKLTEDREAQVQAIGGTEFLYQYEKLGNLDPEKFDAVLEQIHSLVEARKLKAEKEEREAKAEAQKEAIRALRGKALASLQYFYEGDLALLDELGFMQLHSTAKAEYDAAQEQAKAKAEKSKQEHEAKEARQKKAFEDEKERQKQELAVQRANTIKAQNEAKRLADLQAIADAEKAKEEKALQGSDAEKFKLLLDKVRELSDQVGNVSGSSEKGVLALQWLHERLDYSSTKGFDLYNKLR